LIDKQSRYSKTPHFDSERFRGTRPRAIPTTVGVIEHRLTRDDRLDRLAAHYYNDPSKWWLILDANPDISFGGDLDLGTLAGSVIVIPANTTGGRY
jgi:hypothetical protein